MREDARAEIRNPAVHEDVSADRPTGDHPAVADAHTIIGAGGELPHSRAIGGGQAVRIAIIGAEVDPPLGHRRREAHGRAAQVSPDSPTATMWLAAS